MSSTVVVVLAFGFANGALQHPTFAPAVVAETNSLEFHVSTPSTGSLDAQIRAALGELTTKSGGGRLVKLRVFAVGAADLDSSRSAIARILTESKGFSKDDLEKLVDSPSSSVDRHHVGLPSYK